MTDGDITTEDVLSISVVPENQPPVVDAGEDQTILVSETLTLLASATDDGLPHSPGELITAWTRLSGPGEVAFGDTSLTHTSALFSQPGTYVLNLTASDGDLSASDTLTITVEPDPTPPITETVIDKAFQNAVDSYISQSSPNANYGSAITLEVDNGPHFATLLKWDVSDIPAGSVVEAVTFELEVVNPTSDTYEIYELKKSWAESQVTWASATSQSQWQIAGAQGSNDRGDVVIGTLTAALIGLVTIQLNAAGLATVQSWIDNPTQNYGITIQDYSNAPNGLGFVSSEAAAASSRPKLTVSYRLPETSTPNEAPLVDAGTDQSISVSESLLLDGTVIDNTIPSPSGTITTTWQEVSGPGEVTFLDASALGTSAQFSEPGHLHSASDGSRRRTLRP